MLTLLLSRHPGTGGSYWLVTIGALVAFFMISRYILEGVNAYEMVRGKRKEGRRNACKVVDMLVFAGVRWS